MIPVLHTDRVPRRTENYYFTHLNLGARELGYLIILLTFTFVQYPVRTAEDGTRLLPLSVAARDLL